MGLGHVVPDDASQTCFDENAYEGGHVERRGIPGFSTTMQEPDFTTLVSMSIDSSGSSNNTPNVQQDARGLASPVASGDSVTATASNPELVDLAMLGYADSTADAPDAYAGQMPSEKQLEMMLQSCGW
ncbi:hypothetical protein ACEPAH_9263 [Sanghuangporus vaninii]